MIWWKTYKYDLLLLGLVSLIVFGTMASVRRGAKEELTEKVALANPMHAEPACTAEVLNLLDIVAYQADQAGAHYDHAHGDAMWASRYRRLAQETRTVRNGCLGHGIRWEERGGAGTDR